MENQLVRVGTCRTHRSYVLMYVVVSRLRCYWRYLHTANVTDIRMICKALIQMRQGLITTQL